MHELNNYSPDPPWIQCCDRSHCGAARPARSPSASVYAHAQLSAFGSTYVRARAHPDRSCDFVNQLAGETR